MRLRIAPEMTDRLNRYEQHLRELDPNVRINRAGLILSLVERGLLDFELEVDDDADSSTSSKPVVRW